MDWQAIDALGTWVVGVAASVIAFVGFRRERNDRRAAARKEALIALSHLQDVYEVVVAKRQGLKMYRAALTSADERRVLYDSVADRQTFFSQISLNGDQRLALAELYDEVIGANKRLSLLAETDARVVYARTNEFVRFSGEKDIAEVQAKDAIDLLTQCKRGIEKLERKLVELKR